MSQGYFVFGASVQVVEDPGRQRSAGSSAILRHVVGVSQHSTLSRDHGWFDLDKLPDIAESHVASPLRRVFLGSA